MVLVEMNEGDTLRLGCSTRVCRLHWFPLDRAFNVESSLLSPILENPLKSEEKEMSQVRISSELFEQLFVEVMIGIVYVDLMLFEVLENENLSPSAPPLPGHMDFWFLDDDEVVSQASPVRVIDENQSPLRVLEERKVLGIWSESVNSSSLPVERVLSEALDENYQTWSCFKGSLPGFGW